MHEAVYGESLWQCISELPRGAGHQILGDSGAHSFNFYWSGCSADGNEAWHCRATARSRTGIRGAWLVPTGLSQQQLEVPRADLVRVAHLRDRHFQVCVGRLASLGLQLLGHPEFSPGHPGPPLWQKAHSVAVVLGSGCLLLRWLLYADPRVTPLWRSRPGCHASFMSHSRR
jgi:hypothetical protein